ncbi:ROK family transcriptional regulator [Micromonospora saelicesensis]|uniref:Sugar kinase of the NBD/HSP70 family, may contain an N-terminal HTH domain n=1 Tax=Micromonospora saelicesensis TaxID=285676 RepID=A0A1C4TX07_9ACTN|nr:ROK family transcriptional regulator [Micromonospora saelicesensis]RAO42659.1 Xylose repressor [Micromonospora saelicesensis]RAO50590.1 Xylose repressor [Micromonospora saelicesensis]SCE63982.1 Sugar kinase of the NBD/HSP70 family, may contain an N-terminal HTH domain [Micromonospora saelicesensis]
MTIDDAPRDALRGGPRELLRWVATGAAVSRADLSRLSGLSPSTVSQRVEALISQGLLEEAGAGRSRGGRRPRQLAVPTGGAVVGAIDLGAHHARVGALDLSGRVVQARTLPVRIEDGPEAVLGALLAEVATLVDGDPATSRGGSATGALRGVGIGIPGPVQHSTGRIVSPSRMPGWNGFDVAAFCAGRVDVPVIVDNDANLMALGAHRTAHSELDHAVYIKAGTGIGSGVISSGRLHRGAQGSAGDISHCRVVADPAPPCTCGNAGCLEAVASGAALVTALREQGVPVSDLTGVIRLIDDGDRQATALARQAGRAVGEILAVVVNFFNPQVVAIGGRLADCEPLLASMRATLYERCLPLATQTLLIERVAAGQDLGITGAAHLVIDHVVAAA